MGNKLKDTDTKNSTNIDPNKIKTHENSYKNIIYHTGYVTVKNLRYIKINSINPL